MGVTHQKEIYFDFLFYLNTYLYPMKYFEIIDQNGVRNIALASNVDVEKSTLTVDGYDFIQELFFSNTFPIQILREVEINIANVTRGDTNVTYHIEIITENCMNSFVSTVFNNKFAQPLTREEIEKIILEDCNAVGILSQM